MTPLRTTFRTPYQQHAARDGQAFTVVRKITEPDDEHDEEVLPMYAIRFADGVEIDAWPEEVEDVPLTLRDEIAALYRRLAAIRSDHFGALADARSNLAAANRIVEDDPTRARELLQLATEQADTAEG